jgi:hypothetical protein
MQRSGRVTADVAPRLAEVFAACGLSDRGIREAFGVPDSAGLWTADVNMALRGGLAEEDVDPHLATLVRLFVLGAPTPASAVTAALGPDLSADAVAAGVIAETAGGEQRVRVRLVPEGDLLIASDLETVGADCVTGINHAALTLSQLTVRGPVASALDVGTGSGFQALLAAAHSDVVVGTDIKALAVSYGIGVAADGPQIHVNGDYAQGSDFLKVTYKLGEGDAASAWLKAVDGGVNVTLKFGNKLVDQKFLAGVKYDDVTTQAYYKFVKLNSADFFLKFTSGESYDLKFQKVDNGTVDLKLVQELPDFD